MTSATGAAKNGTFRVTRVQLNVVARRERQLLTFLCARLPRAVTPDGLTVLSVLGAVLVFASYLASRSDPRFLWLASLGFVLNWFGDSLDGSLARFRGIERPIYGYFLDHTVDALNNLIMMIGLGLTTAVRMDVSLFALTGYFMLCMYVFISNHLSGVFQLSFLGFGPTELRICLIAINTSVALVGIAHWTVGGIVLTPYDALVLFAGAMFVAVFASRVVIGIRELRPKA